MSIVLVLASEVQKHAFLLNIVMICLKKGKRQFVLTLRDVHVFVILPHKIHTLREDFCFKKWISAKLQILEIDRYFKQIVKIRKVHSKNYLYRECDNFRF